MADTFADVSSIGSTDTGVDSSVDSSNDSYDTQTDDGSGVDDGSGSGEGSGEHTEGEHSQQGSERTDGRKGPASLRNTLKTLSESAPEHAAALKALGASHFRAEAYRKEFATPAEAASAKALITDLGGVEGLANIQQSQSHYQAQDERLKNGDPAVLDTIFQEFGEGAAQLAAPFLEKLATANPTALQAAVVPYAISMLENAGFSNTIKAIYNESDPAKVKQMVAGMYNWFQQQAQSAGQLNAKPTKNPAEDRLKQQQTELQTERETLFTQGVSGRINTSLRPQLDKTVDQLAKKNKWNDEQKAEFTRRLSNDIDRQMKADKTYMGQVGIRYAAKNRSHDSVANYIAGEYMRVLNSKDGAMKTEAAFNRLIGKQTGTKQGTGTGVVKPTTPQTAPGGGPVRVSQRPSDDQIDFSKTDTFSLMKSEAWLKNGRRVSWRTWA
jgi:hypothetical protein